jgi:hypothetical protein
MDSTSGINMTTPDQGVEFGWEHGHIDAQLAVSNGTASGPVTGGGKSAFGVFGGLRTFLRTRQNTSGSTSWSCTAISNHHHEGYMRTSTAHDMAKVIAQGAPLSTPLSAAAVGRQFGDRAPV